MHVELSGYLREMQHSADEVVRYQFATDGGVAPMDDWLGKTIQITASGSKRCIHCGRSVKKLYQNGYCYPCVTTLAECDLCIVKPHECHFHLGTCRDADFAEAHCMIPHYVYLAYSSGVKVGLTRKGRQRTRWVDQGAMRAILFAELPTRKLAGELEMEIAKSLPDKTDWRKMLRETAPPEIDLGALKDEVAANLPEAFRAFVLADEREVHEFRYPRLEDVDIQTKSVSLDKVSEVSGRVYGVKGQYLLLDSGVWNVKKHSGYEVKVTVCD
ncbi:hypothetical protein GCM10025857_38470 [Alicyclobacillus contaminans]|nr:hypothetical protein GCM10025857_38470 [Alicyclobacillus contaminans]